MLGFITSDKLTKHKIYAGSYAHCQLFNIFDWKDCMVPKYTLFLFLEGQNAQEPFFPTYNKFFNSFLLTANPLGIPKIKNFIHDKELNIIFLYSTWL